MAQSAEQLEYSYPPLEFKNCLNEQRTQRVGFLRKLRLTPFPVREPPYRYPELVSPYTLIIESTLMRNMPNPMSMCGVRGIWTGGEGVGAAVAAADVDTI